MSARNIQEHVGKMAIFYLRNRDEELNALKAENKALREALKGPRGPTAYHLGVIGPVGPTGPAPPPHLHDAY